MVKRKQLFELFTKTDLIKISKDLGYGGWSVLSKAEIVNRLSRKRSIAVNEILVGLKIAELRSICLKLGLNPGGLRKQTLIDRITGKDQKPQPLTKKHRPKKTNKKAKPLEKKTKTIPKTNKHLDKRKPKVASENGNDIQNRLWATANNLWANTGLSPSQFSTPVLGLIFLRYAESKFKKVQGGLKSGSSIRRQVQESQTAYQAKGAVFLPEQARFSYLQDLPEGENLGKAINDAMNDQRQLLFPLNDN